MVSGHSSRQFPPGQLLRKKSPQDNYPRNFYPPKITPEQFPPDNYHPDNLLLWNPPEDNYPSPDFSFRKITPE